MKDLRKRIEDVCDNYGLLEVYDLSKMRSVYLDNREEILDELVRAAEDAQKEAALPIADHQHCTYEGDDDGEAHFPGFSHTAAWCGRPQPRRCGCPYCYPKER